MHKISRSKLYQLVWDAPLTMVATRFNVTPTVLGRICDTHEIPRPGQGYWSRRVSGHLLSTDEPPGLPVRDTVPDQVVVEKPRTKADDHREAWQRLRDRAARIEPAPVRARKVRKQASEAAKVETIPETERSLKQEERQKHRENFSSVILLAYSVARLSDALSLSRTTIYRLIADGELHPIRVGSRTLVAASEVDQWIAKKLDEAKR